MSDELIQKHFDRLKPDLELCWNERVGYCLIMISEEEGNSERLAVRAFSNIDECTVTRALGVVYHELNEIHTAEPDNDIQQQHTI